MGVFDCLIVHLLIKEIYRFKTIFKTRLFKIVWCSFGGILNYQEKTYFLLLFREVFRWVSIWVTWYKWLPLPSLVHKADDSFLSCATSSMQRLNIGDVTWSRCYARPGVSTAWAGVFTGEIRCLSASRVHEWEGEGGRLLATQMGGQHLASCRVVVWRRGGAGRGVWWRWLAA